MAEEKVKRSGIQTLVAFFKIIIEEVKKLIAKAVSDVKADLGSALTYKGSVADYDSLPKEGQAKGDTYNVVAAHGNTPAGTNYAWDGSKWDPLGGDIDLSNLVTDEEFEEELGKKLDTATYNAEKADFLTEDDLEDYAKTEDVVSNETYTSDKATFETKDNASKTYQTQAGMSDYLKTAELPNKFEEITETELRSALSDLLSGE